MVLRKILFILLMMKNLAVDASGLDAYSSCYRTSRKRQELPCDFGSQTWCTIPGNSYPWHAVRRFVHENQGLMRRMYGDERHISVLRAELENNDLEFFNSPSIKEEFRRRYSKEMDGAKDFVKMFMSSEGKRFVADSKAGRTTKVEKIQKSIEETSNNVLYQNHFKNSKEELKTTNFGDGIGVGVGAGVNKTASKTTTPPPVSVMDTTPGMMTNEPPLNNATAETTNLFGLNELATEPVVQTENAQYNLSNAAAAAATQSTNDSQSREDLNYDGNTEEPQTTTNLDNLTTTETEFEEDEEVQRNKGEDVKKVETETVEEEKVENFFMAQPSPPPQIRLKGINACPVKEEVVAPFWANNTRGEVLALLNLYPFEQYVHWEKCTYEHKQMFCRKGCRCEQQYRLHRLLAYDPNNECRGIFSDWFRFPSCCVCKCYDLPIELRLTSRSPRFQNLENYEEEYLNKLKSQP